MGPQIPEKAMVGEKERTSGCAAEITNRQKMAVEMNVVSCVRTQRDAHKVPF